MHILGPPLSLWQFELIPQQKVTDYQLDGVAGQKPARAAELAMPKVQVVLIRGSELMLVALAGQKTLPVMPESVKRVWVWGNGRVNDNRVDGHH